MKKLYKNKVYYLKYKERTWSNKYPIIPVVFDYHKKGWYYFKHIRGLKQNKGRISKIKLSYLLNKEQARQYLKKYVEEQI